MLSLRKMKVLLLLAMLTVNLTSGCGSRRETEELATAGPPPKIGIKDPELNYKISFGFIEAAEPRLQIELSFLMPYHEVHLELPGKYAAKKSDLSDRIEGLQLVSKVGILSDTGDKRRKKLTAPQGELVQLAYQVKSYSPSESEKTESFYAAVIDNDYVSLVGSMALIVPDPYTSWDQKKAIRIKYELPEDFPVYTSFGSPHNNQQTLMTSLHDFRDAVFIAGSKIRVNEVSVRGKPVTIALNGTWPKITDEQWAKSSAALLNVQRATWHDDNFPHFLVTLWAKGKTCVPQNGVTFFKYRGRAHYHAFRSKYAPLCELSPAQIQLMSHEMMHMWLGKIIQVGEDSSGNDGKWLTEGWTDYYGRIMAFRAGQITLGEYFSTLNAPLAAYQKSRVNTVNLADLTKRYDDGKDPDSELLFQIPYEQGEMMALRLNKKIKEVKGFNFSLDNVVLDLLAAAKLAGGKKKFKVAEIEAIVDKYAGAGAFNAEYIKVKDGSPLMLPPETLAHCAQLVTKNVTLDPAKPAVSAEQYELLNPADQSSCDEWLKH